MILNICSQRHSHGRSCKSMLSSAQFGPTWSLSDGKRKERSSHLPVAWFDARHLGRSAAFHGHTAGDQLGSGEEVARRSDDLRGSFVCFYSVALAAFLVSRLAGKDSCCRGHMGRRVAEHVEKTGHGRNDS